MAPPYLDCMRTNRRVTAAAVALLLISCVACVHVRLEDRAAWRRQQYLQNNPELPPRIVDAIDRGHVVIGMTEAQVRAALGSPVYVKVFESQSTKAVWLYPGHRLHQDQLHTDAKGLFRIVFINHRVAVIEGI